MHWQNKQNLKNAKFFKEEDRIEILSLSWAERYLIDRFSEKLNGKEFKLAPRRHKYTPEEAFIDELTEVLNDDDPQPS